MRLAVEVFYHRELIFLAEHLKEGQVKYYDVSPWMTKKKRKHLKGKLSANFFIYLTRGKVRKLKFNRRARKYLPRLDLEADFEKLDKLFS